MVLCFAACCNHRTGRNGCSFFRFPKNQKLRALWSNMSRRADKEPSSDSRLCSCHFADGKKENGPTLFSYRKDKMFDFPSPVKRIKKSKESAGTATGTSGDIAAGTSADTVAGTSDDSAADSSAGTSSDTAAGISADSAAATAAGISADSAAGTSADTAAGSSTDIAARMKSSNYLDSPAVLKSENEALMRKIALLEKELEKNQLYFAFSRIMDKPKLVLMYTGIPNKDIFHVLLKYIERFQFKYYYGWNVSMPLEDQLFITLQKLRLNYNFLDIAVRYSVSETTIRNIFYTFVHVLHESLFEFIYWDYSNVPSLHKVNKVSPISEDFPNCRFLIDCTEIYVETPRSNMEAQKQTYSNYKHRQTFKALIVVAPNGVICFCSELFPGSCSDKYIVEKSDVCKLFKPGDLIISDKGFLIRDLLPKGVLLNMPPFLSNPQFTEQEARYTTQIARARIHVERAIQRVKSFNILDNMSHNFRTISSKIFQVCVLLVSFQTPLINDD